MPGASPAAASTIPSDTPNFILRGARLATIGVSRPTRSSGLYADLIPAATMRAMRRSTLEKSSMDIVAGAESASACAIAFADDAGALPLPLAGEGWGEGAGFGEAMRPSP